LYNICYNVLDMENHLRVSESHLPETWPYRKA
jgi:hypothetical protein